MWRIPLGVAGCALAIVWLIWRPTESKGSAKSPPGAAVRPTEAELRTRLLRLEARLASLESAERGSEGASPTEASAKSPLEGPTTPTVVSDVEERRKIANELSEQEAVALLIDRYEEVFEMGTKNSGSAVKFKDRKSVV